MIQLIFIHLAKVQTKEKLRKCPICGRKMEKFMFNDVLLDRCPSRCGIWFDKNEFSTCVNSLKSDSSTSEQIKFLGEVFNR